MKLMTDENISYVRAKIEYDKIKRNISPTQLYSQSLSMNQLSVNHTATQNTATATEAVYIQTQTAVSKSDDTKKLREDINKLMEMVAELQTQNVNQSARIGQLEMLVEEKDKIIAETNK